MTKQLECRIVIIHKRVDPYNLQGPRMFELGMYDPANKRYEKLGEHPVAKIDKIVGDLKVSILRAGHHLTFSEYTE